MKRAAAIAFELLALVVMGFVVIVVFNIMFHMEHRTIEVRMPLPRSHSI